MIQVSETFRAAMTADCRRIRARVAIDYTDPFVDAALAISASQQALPGFLLQAADNVSEPAFRWSAADGFAFPDGNWFPAPATAAEGQLGWWGTQVSGADGAFIAPFPTLTMDIASRPIHSLRVIGDARRGEFPVDFEYRLFGSGDILRFTRTITDNTLIDWREDIAPVTEVVRIVLEVRRWSHADRTSKILETFTSVQEIYEGDAIMSISLLEERELAHDSLPVGNVSANEISLKLDNSTRKFDAGNRQSPLYQLLKPNRRIRAWLSGGPDDEWVPLGTFWSNEWQALSEKMYVSTTGRDRLDALGQSTYSVSHVHSNISLHGLAAEILIDAGLSASEFWVDPALQGIIVPNAWFGTVSHRTALRQIAEASLGQVYTDRHGIIRIEGVAYLLGQETFVSPMLPSTQSLTVTADNYYNKNTPVKWSDVANRIEVETQPLLPAEVLEEVFRSNEPIEIDAGQTRRQTVFYNAQPVIDAVASLIGAPAGATITAATYYAWGADVTVSSPLSAGTYLIAISGRPLRVLNRERAVAEDANSIREHGRLRYRFPENHLVQSMTQARTIADTLLRLYRSPRRDLVMSWRGNPALTLGDMLMTPDHGQWLRYWVVKQTIDFDGGLRASLEGRLAR